MENVHVVVIDSGISSRAFFEPELDYCGFHLKKQNNCYELAEGCEDKLGHGTSVMNIFYQYCPDIKYTVIDIYDENILLDEEKFLYILNYIYNNISCDIINISSGLTVSFRKRELENICDKIYDKGIALVAAFDNLGAISYPAFFKNVIGVDGNINIRNIEDYYYNQNCNINIVGSFGERMLIDNNNEKKMRGGTSFIAPFISCKIAGYIKKEKLSLNLINKKLENDSIKVNDFNREKEKNNIIKINKAVLFPYNKEIDSLCRYADLTVFEIKKVCDFKYWGNIGEIIENSNINLKISIEDIYNLDWDLDFDWFVLGHVLDILDLFKENIAEFIIKKCLEHRKNLYVFDYQIITEKIMKQFEKNKLIIYCPIITKNQIPYSNLGKLYNSSTPIVGVFGTGSKQGKFTTQLNFRRILLNMGYNVGQIGTEPTSALFGMDYTLPLGFNARNELDEKEFILFVNEKIRQLENMEKDIIIIGSQSQTIPYDYSNIKCMPMYQQALLTGVRPDIVILCVNIFDEIEYIKRTIIYIEAVSETKVLAIVVSPFADTKKWTIWGNMDFCVNDNSLVNIKKRFNTINIPVFVPKTEKDYENIVQLCLDYLYYD